MVYCDGGYMFTAWYSHGGEWFNYPTDKPLMRGEKVTHWMPLPEPPK